MGNIVTKVEEPLLLMLCCHGVIKVVVLSFCEVMAGVLGLAMTCMPMALLESLEMPLRLQTALNVCVVLRVTLRLLPVLLPVHEIIPPLHPEAVSVILLAAQIVVLSALILGAVGLKREGTLRLLLTSLVQPLMLQVAVKVVVDCGLIKSGLAVEPLLHVILPVQPVAVSWL